MKPFSPLSFLHSLRPVVPITLLVLPLMLMPLTSRAAGKAHSSDLAIVRDPATGKLNVTWSSGGALKQSRTVDGPFKPVRTRGKSHVATPDEDQLVFRVESAGAGTVYSVNVVGYINQRVPPGLSLLANQLRNQENSVSFLIYNPPDGAQVYKYVEEVGYEVSTFDGATRTWSNPDMDLSPGIGFFFRNPSAEFTITFVGEVLQGTLINRLPAGFSTEGALVPQAVSLSSHGIPGEPGDIVRLYVNDGLGSEDYTSSVFSATEGGWVPDLILPVGAGFISERQNAQDWVRTFYVN